ncbi:hypothetical protein ABK905_25435 [Acerihabitans sp. KWT182]|uniref:Uncharacterized protein n=1 Tax=Acerihabitans sp. KWT182 TaxID=3157919 RepID=A0AAU7QAB7_9GAMM
MAHSRTVNPPARQQTEAPSSAAGFERAAMPLTRTNLERWEKENPPLPKIINGIPIKPPAATLQHADSSSRQSGSAGGD